MPNIKPISELRNYTNVVKDVKYGSRVYLTKNGHGQIAMINMQELDEIEKELEYSQIVRRKFLDSRAERRNQLIIGANKP